MSPRQLKHALQYNLEAMQHCVSQHGSHSSLALQCPVLKVSGRQRTASEPDEKPFTAWASGTPKAARFLSLVTAGWQAQADICQLGMDQRKVNVLAREYCDECRPKRKLKPIILSHHMMPGLLAVA